MTKDEIVEFDRWLNDAADGILPKMKSSAFCMAAITPHGTDAYLALQVGMALLLEKPLIIIATGNAWIPERVRKLADAVVEGPNLQDLSMKERMQEAIRAVLCKRGLTQ